MTENIMTFNCFNCGLILAGVVSKEGISITCENCNTRYSFGPVKEEKFTIKKTMEEL